MLHRWITVFRLSGRSFSTRSGASAAAQHTFKPNPLRCLTPVPNDLEIALAQKPLPIMEVASNYGIHPDRVMSYGPYMAKILPDKKARYSLDQALGRYVVVTGTTPTKHGEGKTTTTMGLAQAMGSHIKVPTIAVIRQPSQGPTFGLKGKFVHFSSLSFSFFFFIFFIFFILNDNNNNNNNRRSCWWRILSMYSNDRVQFASDWRHACDHCCEQFLGSCD